MLNASWVPHEAAARLFAESTWLQGAPQQHRVWRRTSPIWNMFQAACTANEPRELQETAFLPLVHHSRIHTWHGVCVQQFRVHSARFRGRQRLPWWPGDV